MAQAVRRRLILSEARVRAWSVRMGFVGSEVALGQVFLPIFNFYPVIIILKWLSMLICHLGGEQ
jgi:hypothetical protein